MAWRNVRQGAGTCVLAMAAMGPWTAVVRGGGPAGIALVRHAPEISGTVDGSVQQLLGEGVTLSGGATVTGDLLVPGTPAVRLNGKPGLPEGLGIGY